MPTRLKKKAALTSLIPLGLMLAGAGCRPGADLDSRLEAIAAPYQFSIAGWEIRTLPGELAESLGPWGMSPEAETSLVTEYFEASRRINSLDHQLRNDAPAALETERAALKERKAELEPRVERILERQIATVLGAEDIYNFFDSSGYPRPAFHLPPVNFQLETPPHVLVISPRDNIQSQREILLRQDLSLAEMGSIETAADGLGVSSLVMEIGGLAATYPSFVANDGSLRFTVAAAVEEWLHQYLLFQPLGALYGLDAAGLAPDYDVATINETVVGLASEEIADIVGQRYYAEEYALSSAAAEPEFSFNQVMRETRLQVDEYLAAGRVEAAEAYMEQRRQYLAANGYYIRKLNQAYFAFHGTYANSPASVSPIGTLVRSLRVQSASIKEFLVLASRLSSLDTLTLMVERTAPVVDSTLGPETDE